MRSARRWRALLWAEADGRAKNFVARCGFLERYDCVEIESNREYIEGGWRCFPG
jgi:hypothetical protein